MKTIKLIALLFVFSITTNANAQFFKKLTERAQEAAAQTVERKVAEKTERETEKSFDTVFNNKGRLFKNKKAEKLELYSFSHEYVMEITSDNEITDITYYLTNEHEYMGSSFSMGKDQEFITVMDLPNSSIHTFMDMDGQRTMNSIHIDLEDSSDLEMNKGDYSITPTGQTKKVLGYECEEFQVTGPQLSGSVWVTQEADISFQKAFTKLKTKRIKTKKGIDQSWVSMVDGLTLEMNMIDYSQKNAKPIKMICTQLIENEFSINTLDYEKPF
ncbi:DUF4412 domain-containing protein [Maribacter hydrothermalis]|uniref:DUF4412 domain-containing protein n=1 Tax=Maribacter hydrothermalis TaxID=1836467 RepID=A0A1B7ZEU7_9FLAO|nr:DUF4412 domain-containing protein [Maribacter hydrothermalis]APQ17605.1 hypothetical protein BTR34_09805 [Maribacter hydrothermalis]OBR42080.1 hypothetical protein A9200_01435 [Maribacter hydrothermalis]